MSSRCGAFDSLKRFHYGCGMAEYTLKNIPADIYHRTQAAAENSFRSLNQEIIWRLRRSFDAEEARTSALHAKWVMEALESGATKPLKMQELDAAFARGAKRAAARRPRARSWFIARCFWPTWSSVRITFPRKLAKPLPSRGMLP